MDESAGTHITASPVPAQNTQKQHLNRFVILLIIAIVFVLIAPEHIRNYILWNINEHRVLSALVLLFITLALSIIWSFGAKLDDLVFHFLNNYGPRSLAADRVMQLMTQVGNGLTAFIIAGIFYLLNRRIFAFQLIFGTISLWLLVEFIKLLVGRKRPYISLEAARIVGHKAGGYSFPSGHTSQAFFLVAFLGQALQLPLIPIVLLYLVAVITGVTRIYLGAHYPRDVIAGAFLGALWGYTANVLYGVVISGIG